MDRVEDASVEQHCVPPEVFATYPEIDSGTCKHSQLYPFDWSEANPRTVPTVNGQSTETISVGDM